MVYPSPLLQTMKHVSCYVLLQVYALGGRGRVTSRVYPSGVSDSWEYSVFSSSSAVAWIADIKVYEMGEAFGAENATACC